jgi:deazaflavin-dependent oxidoreductase (nitroreductase family)
VEAPRTRLRFMRPFTTRIVNPLTRRIAGWMPWFGIIICRGRKTGTEYRVPMNVFRNGDHYVFALTYGSDVNWVQNVLAAGECRLITGRRELRLVEPELVVDPMRRLVPQPVRAFLGLIRTTEFLRMRLAPAADHGPSIPRAAS